MESPKDKAVELFNRFDGIAETRGEYDKFYCEIIEIVNKKQCALIVCDEVIKWIQPDEYTEDIREVEHQIDYWNLVKKEIENISF